MTSRVIQTSIYPKDTQDQEYDREMEEKDAILAARACFDARELHRATHILKDCVSPKGKFLRLYCQFIVSAPFALLGYIIYTSINQGIGEVSTARLAQAGQYVLQIYV